MHLRGLLLSSAFLVAWASGAAEAPAKPFDMSRYLGHWYVIAWAPALGESGQPATRLEYRAQGHEVEERRYPDPATPEREPEFLAIRHWTADADDPARWTERSWWPFGARLTVLYVSPDYRQALVDGPDGAQVLARQPQLPEWVYAGLLARLAAQGYDVSLLRRVDPQPATQIKEGTDFGSAP